MKSLTDKTKNLISSLSSSTYSYDEIKEFSTELSEYLGYKIRIEQDISSGICTSIKLYLVGNITDCIALFTLNRPKIGKKYDTDYILSDIYFTDHELSEEDNYISKHVSIKLHWSILKIFNDKINLDTYININEFDEFSTELYLTDVLTRNRISCSTKIFIGTLKLYQRCVTNGIDFKILDIGVQSELQERLFRMYEHII